MDTIPETVPSAKWGGLRALNPYKDGNRALRKTLTGRVIQIKTQLEEPAVELCKCRTCNRSPI